MGFDDIHDFMVIKGCNLRLSAGSRSDELEDCNSLTVKRKEPTDIVKSDICSPFPVDVLLMLTSSFGGSDESLKLI